MSIFLYDKTFDGFLTLVFEAFEYKNNPHRIEGLDFKEPQLWMEKISVVTDNNKADRVWAALKKRLSPLVYNGIFRIHLSQASESEMALFRFIVKVFASKVNIEENFADTDVLRVRKLDKQICKEAERMRQFVRFQKTVDEIFYAAGSPEFNVIPLIVKHFETRFADQQWIIYDSARDYGFYYNCQHTEIIKLDSDKISLIDGKVNKDVLSENEVHFQQMWKQYFKSTCIEERRNEKLQMQHMPKRYWKYLTEKQEN